MADPRNIHIQDYTYTLPEERIARYPLSERDASKLLLFKNRNISEDIYRNIAYHIPEGSLLVFNNTKVIEARLLFQKSTGGVIELFCLNPYSQYADIITAMQQTRTVLWNCMIGGASKWKPGQILEKKGNDVLLKAKYVKKSTDSFLIEFSWLPFDLSFVEVLHHVGAVPLPPYLKREAETLDKERYQTIFASTEGSVAAPTAGLHFTEYIFKQLDKKNIKTEFLTLHVGAGTFKPVKSEIIGGHPMHGENFEIGLIALETIIDHLDCNIIPVGTTSLRALESLYWIGVKILNGNISFEVSQWDPYVIDPDGITASDALIALKKELQKAGEQRVLASTSLLIAPSYKFRIANALITNFHQPQSTLLLLVAAFIGEDWSKVYEYALNNDFRFLSYGDGCLLWASNQLTS